MAGWPHLQVVHLDLSQINTMRLIIVTAIPPQNSPFFHFFIFLELDAAPLAPTPKAAGIKAKHGPQNSSFNMVFLLSQDKHNSVRPSRDCVLKR